MWPVSYTHRWAPSSVLGGGISPAFLSSKNNYMLSKQFSPLFSERTNTNLGKPIGKKEGTAQNPRLRVFRISSPGQDITAFPVSR